MLRELRVAGAGVHLNCAVGPPAGEPLILFHGVCRCWQDLLPLAAPLALRWQLWMVDHRGHGKSDRADRYDVNHYLDDAVELVRSFSAPVRLLGHSLGAMVAAAVAARLPDQVRAVVLEDPPFHTMGERIGQTNYQQMFAAWRDLTRQFAARHQTESRSQRVTQIARELADVRVGQQRLGELRDAVSLRFTASCLSTMDPRVLDSIVAGEWLRDFSLTEVASKIRAPLLVFQADPKQGGMLTDDDAALLTSSAPQATLVRTPGVGHLIHGTAPDLILRHVGPFFEST